MDKMDPKISVKRDYILVEPEERDFWKIIESAARLFETPEYPEKDVVWLFREGPLEMTYDDLYRIKEFVKNNLPQITKQDKKVALVVETGLHAAMAEEYTKIVSDLPQTFKVFFDLGEAVDWVLNR